MTEFKNDFQDIFQTVVPDAGQKTQSVFELARQSLNHTRENLYYIQEEKPDPISTL